MAFLLLEPNDGAAAAALAFTALRFSDATCTHAARRAFESSFPSHASLVEPKHVVGKVESGTS